MAKQSGIEPERMDDGQLWRFVRTGIIDIALMQVSLTQLQREKLMDHVLDALLELEKRSMQLALFPAPAERGPEANYRVFQGKDSIPE
jgi:hypothetical protein